MAAAEEYDIARSGVTFRPAVRRKLSEQILGQFRELLESGRVGPGDRLPPERELARIFGVSRNSVREAIRALEEQGWVVSRRGDGTYVSDPESAAFEPPLAGAVRSRRKRLADILAFRRALEPEVAALAARNATESELRRLAAVLAEQAESLEHGRDDADLDVEFHRLLARAGRNGVFLSVFTAVQDVLAECRAESLRGPSRRAVSLVSHRRILKALEGRNPEEARTAMREHLDAVEENLLGLPDVPDADQP
ncbi:FCD domain-containing protein [Desulfovibrio aminophilus]|uniref:FadR/GntR family transcriptional regulator n=1 Tax=Desulfovibrio aminophilus TaxID=81425 RepID=UPI0033969326